MNNAHHFAQRLLEKARGDALILMRLADDATVPIWGLGFHAQQAVEKAIKAVLTFNVVEYPRTHNLAVLVALLREHNLSIPPEPNELACLTPFGAVLRYDDTVPDSDVVLAPEWARDTVQQVIVWAEGVLAG